MFVKLMKGEQKVWIKETERETSTAKAEKPRKIAWQGKRGETLKSAGVRALRGRDIKRVYPRASERRQERRTRRKARSEAPLHFQVQECRFDKHLVFFFFLFFLEKKKKKKTYEKPSFMPRLKGGIRRRQSEWKTQTFLYTSCAFTCQSAAIKRNKRAISQDFWILKA